MNRPEARVRRPGRAATRTRSAWERPPPAPPRPWSAAGASAPMPRRRRQPQAAASNGRVTSRTVVAMPSSSQSTRARSAELRRIQVGASLAGGEVAEDRVRLSQVEVAVDERRDAADRVHREVPGGPLDAERHLADLGDEPELAEQEAHLLCVRRAWVGVQDERHGRDGTGNVPPRVVRGPPARRGVRRRPAPPAPPAARPAAAVAVGRLLLDDRAGRRDLRLHHGRDRPDAGRLAAGRGDLVVAGARHRDRGSATRQPRRRRARRAGARVGLGQHRRARISDRQLRVRPRGPRAPGAVRAVLLRRARASRSR